MDNKTFSGEWVNGRKHGEGTMILPTGDQFTGVWEGGKLTGGVYYTFHEQSPWNNADF